MIGITKSLIKAKNEMTGFHCDPQPLTMFIRYFETIYYISIQGLTEPPIESCITQFQRYLLDANYHMVMAKFSTDPKGRAALTVELPETVTSYELFVNALYLLAENAQYYIGLLGDASTDSAFESPYAGEGRFFGEEEK